MGGQRKGRDRAPLSVCFSPEHTAPGDGPDGRVGSSISDFLLSFPSSLSGSWQSFYSTFLLSAAAKGRGCEGPHSLGRRIGCLAKAGLFPFPARNLLVASRGPGRLCVGSLGVTGRGQTGRHTARPTAELELVSKDPGRAGRGRETAAGGTAVGSVRG